MRSVLAVTSIFATVTALSMAVIPFVAATLLTVVCTALGTAKEFSPFPIALPFVLRTVFAAALSTARLLASTLSRTVLAAVMLGTTVAAVVVLRAVLLPISTVLAISVIVLTLFRLLTAGIAVLVTALLFRTVLLFLAVMFLLAVVLIASGYR